MCAKKLLKCVRVFLFVKYFKKIPTTTAGGCRLFMKCLHYCCCACKAFHAVEAQMQFARITVEDLTLKTQRLLDFQEEVDIFQFSNFFVLAVTIGTKTGSHSCFLGRISTWSFLMAIAIFDFACYSCLYSGSALTATHTPSSSDAWQFVAKSFIVLVV